VAARDSGETGAVLPEGTGAATEEVEEENIGATSEVAEVEEEAAAVDRRGTEGTTLVPAVSYTSRAAQDLIRMRQ
jgi:dihydroxyacetone kinase